MQLVSQARYRAANEKLLPRQSDSEKVVKLASKLFSQNSAKPGIENEKESCILYNVSVSHVEDAPFNTILAIMGRRAHLIFPIHRVAFQTFLKRFLVKAKVMRENGGRPRSQFFVIRQTN